MSETRDIVDVIRDRADAMFDKEDDDSTVVILNKAATTIESLREENAKLRAGAPLGPIIGAATIVDQELELRTLRATVAGLEKALKQVRGLQSCVDSYCTKRRPCDACKTYNIADTALGGEAAAKARDGKGG